MKRMRYAVLLLLLVRGSDGRVGGSVRDLARDDQATFNVPDETSPSTGTLTVGRFQVNPEDQPFATKGTVTLILKCPNLPTAMDAVGQYPEPIVIKADSTLRVVNVPASGADLAFKRMSKSCHVCPDQKVFALPYHKSAADQEGRRLAEQTPYGIPMVLEDEDWWGALPPPTGSSKVCVVDTGYGNGHEDLPLLDVADGHNPYDTGSWRVDGHGHGTHCAGTIGAVGDNDKGVVGVVPDSMNGNFSFFIGKGLKDSGSGTFASVMDAVAKCVEAGSNVISMSLGGGGYDDSMAAQFAEHYEDDDVLIIAAAGNGGNSDLGYPASYPAVMSVAAVDSSGNKASFSQYNDQVEIAGPGVGVKSTIPGDDYATWSGTSMATPHVAGVAALLRMYFPDCKAFQIRNAMIATGKDQGANGCDVNYGHGIVQAKTAYEFLEANPCDPDEPFKEPEGGCDELSCTQDSDCDDGDPDTIDTCQTGSCTTQPIPPTIGCSADATASNYHPNPDVEVCCEWDGVPAVTGNKGTPVSISLHGSPPTSRNGYDAWCQAYVDQVLSDVACALSIPSSYVALGRKWLKSCRKEWKEGGIVVPLILRRNPWEWDTHTCHRLNGQYAAEGSPLWRGNLTKAMRLDGDPPCNIGESSASLEMADVGGDDEGDIFG